MRKLLQTLWLPLIFLLLPSQSEAQNGWVAYSIPAPGGGGFSFGDANTGVIVNHHKYFRTTNSGVSWQTFVTPDTATESSYGGIYFLDNLTGWITGGSTVSPIPYNFMHKTTDGGLTWGPKISVYTLHDIQFLNQSTGYIATGDIPMYGTVGYLSKSTNGGSNWISLLSDNYSYEDLSFLNAETGWVYCYYADDVGIFVNKIMRTNNGGINWDVVFIDSANGTFSPYRGLQFFDENTGYLMNKKIFKSTNGGSNWFLLDTNVFSGNSIRSFFFLNKDTGWIATGPTGKIFRTNDGGTNWVIQNTPVSSVNGKIYFINAQTGWALANSTTILKTTTGGLTSIQNISSEIPESFLLYQNYPNPFNPETKIKFEIPLSVSGERSVVRLSVYDVSGKEVRVLVNSELAPGVYEYSFDGAGLGSGVYFYKFQSGDFIETLRMVLVK